MLKRNLIAVAIMTLGLGITSTAYGQFSDTTQGVKSQRDAASGQATGKSKVRAKARITHDEEFGNVQPPVVHREQEDQQKGSRIKKSKWPKSLRIGLLGNRSREQVLRRKSRAREAPRKDSTNHNRQISGR